MNTAALYHRPPSSEFAYLYTPRNVHIRLRTAKDDIREVSLIQNDTNKFWNGWHDEIFAEKRPLRIIASTDTHDYWMIETSEEHNRVMYAFHIVGNDGMEVFYCDKGVYPVKEPFTSNFNYYFRFPYFHEIDMVKTPDWVKDTVWYQIFPERYWNGDTGNDPTGTLAWNSREPDRKDFFGGDLQGIIDKLDYIKGLGVNGIYLCPVFKSPTTHKYDTTDYFTIDPAFGTKEVMQKLVDECHKHDIKVMLDAVFNHIGDTSEQWQDVVKNGAESKFASWFHIHRFPVSYTQTDRIDDVDNLTYESFGFTPHMPKLNTANPEVQEYLLSVARYWTKACGIDAWRLDVANEVDHHFWKRFYKEMTEINKDIYIIGEAWHSAQSWLQGDEFHAVMNYSFTDAILECFVRRNIVPTKMVAAMNQQLMLYTQQTNEVMFNLLDSHDTPRLLTIANGNKSIVKSTLAFMFVQAGSPCLYYGTEIGMSGGSDPGCRACMEWDESKWDKDIHSFTVSLVALRRKHSDIITYAETKWEIDDERNIIKMTRTYRGHSLVAVFNNGTEDIEIITCGIQLVSSGTHTIHESTVIKAYGFYIGLDAIC